MLEYQILRNSLPKSGGFEGVWISLICFFRLPISAIFDGESNKVGDGAKNGLILASVFEWISHGYLVWPPVKKMESNFEQLPSSTYIYEITIFEYCF